MIDQPQPRHAESVERGRVAKRVTLIGALVNVLLATMKVIVGWLGQSAALLADGIHSFSDLASDVLVWLAAKHAQDEADANHPYGHGRIETLATGGLGLLLIAVAIGIAVDGGQRLFKPERLAAPAAFTLIAALVSIAVKELLYRYTEAAARRINSTMLRANAWHHRTDAISSVVVVIGILGATNGVAYLDSVAAIVVAAMVGRIGFTLSWDAFQELIDHGLDEQRVQRIRELITAVSGVQDLHRLRTRRMGSEALADVHVIVNPRITVSEGHQIGEAVRERLAAQIKELRDVTVHIDPEDDEQRPQCLGLPDRAAIERDVAMQVARTSYPGSLPRRLGVCPVQLHYLAGRVDIDVTLDLEAVADLAQARGIAIDLKRRLEKIDYVGSVVIQYRHTH